MSSTFKQNMLHRIQLQMIPIGLSVTEMYGRTEENDLIARYDGQLMDEEELNLRRAEFVWQGFVTQTNELIMLKDGKVMNDCERPRLDDNCMDDDQYGSVRSIGIGINSGAADIGSEVRGNLARQYREYLENLLMLKCWNSSLILKNLLYFFLLLLSPVFQQGCVLKKSSSRYLQVISQSL